MSMLAKIKALKADKPPRILIYGPPKIGKTTLASEFPDPVFIRIEDGQNSTATLEGWGRDEIKSYADVMEAIRELYEGEHDFKTFVLDSLSELQELIYAETCARGDDKGNVKQRIEDFGYGKGYVYALDVWKEFFEALNMLRLGRGMTIVLIGHVKVDRFDDPETVSYSRYELDVQDGKNSSAQNVIAREMDAILLIKSDVAVKSEEIGPNKKRSHAEGSNRFICCEGAKPSQVSGSRLGIPPKTLYREGKGYEAIAPYLPGRPVTKSAAKAA